MSADDEHHIVSTIHIDIYSLDGTEGLLGDVADLVYGKGVEALVHAHGQACEESDHCCGPGSNWLKAHDAVVAAERQRTAAHPG